MKPIFTLETKHSLNNEQKGRRQAMTNTFIRLGTRPEQYTPTVTCKYGTISHCELCGASLEYYFPLTHVDDPDFLNDKSLYVGGDCLYNFTQLHMPTIAEQILDSIEKAMSGAKTNKFKETYPNIFKDFKELKETLIQIERQWSYHPGRSLFAYQEFFKNYRHLFRQEYLSKPKIKEFYLFKKEVETHWYKKLSLHEKIVKDNKPIKKSKDKFYQDYEKYYLMVYGRFFNKEQRVLSPLEKQGFLEKLEERQHSAQKRINSFANEVLNEASLYLALLKNKNPHHVYFLHLIHNLYGVKDYYKMNFKKELNITTNENKALKPLLKILPYGGKELMEKINENKNK